MVRDRVVEADVADVVAAWTGVPVSRMLEGEADKLLKMEERLSRARRRPGPRPCAPSPRRSAAAAWACATRAARSAASSSSGPTGVGKTELAKALAEFLFDDEHSLTRLDMSEFMEKHMVARLLGSPPGYVDSDEGGYLTEAVRSAPLQRRPLRRDGEGPPRRLQHPAPGARRRSPHRLARPPRPLLRHRHHHDLQRRRPPHPRPPRHERGAAREDSGGSSTRTSGRSS